MPVPNKILIIRFSSIGDIVLATPLLRVLRKKFPLAQIDFVVRKDYADLVKYNDNLDHVYEFEAAGGFAGLRKLKSSLRMQNYDLVVDIHNSLRSRYLRILLGAKDISVVDKRVFARTLLVKFKKNIYGSITSVADRYVEPLKKYGIENDRKGLELRIPDDACSSVIAKMETLKLDRFGKYIGFCASAKHTTKCWPQERFTELGVKLIKDYDTKILLFGGPSDKLKCKTIADRINSLSGYPRAIDMSGELSVLETAAAIEFCNVIVTNDSGLMHIASAMKKKIAVIFGPTVREFGFFPVGPENAVVERNGLYCRPCSHIGSDACPEGHFRCMKEIQVDDVAKAINGLRSA